MKGLRSTGSTFPPAFTENGWQLRSECVKKNICLQYSYVNNCHGFFLCMYILLFSFCSFLYFFFLSSLFPIWFNFDYNWSRFCVVKVCACVCEFSTTFYQSTQLTEMGTSPDPIKVGEGKAEIGTTLIWLAPGKVNFQHFTTTTIPQRPEKCWGGPLPFLLNQSVKQLNFISTLQRRPQKLL